ncbi:unnamed protein product [Dicrocoelium dendriticum]|nr:unnamed protein product [Dicrocoelium dendriticum]
MDKFESLLTRLERVTHHLEMAVPTKIEPFAPNGDIDNSLTLKDFSDIVSGPLAEYLTLSSKIGGDVGEQSGLLRECFISQQRLLELVVSHPKPSDSELKDLIRRHCEPISAVVEFKDKRRSSPHFNHISAVAESAVALGWVGVSPAPAPYVKDMQEAAHFFTNRVLKDNKDANPDHIAWTKALMLIWTNLQTYICKHFRTGLVWNENAQTEVSKSAPTGPPPVPPMPAPGTTTSPVQSDNLDSRGALFKLLNQGEKVTAGLRKVTDDMKTHKNPALRAASGAEPAPAVAAKPKSAAVATAKQPPVLELRGNKWVVENQDKQQLAITQTQPKQSVYVFNCVECTLQIKGKVNSLMLDKCKKTGAVFDDIIASVDVVNCQSVQVQSMGKLQTVNVDKTDGCQIYLSAESKFADVIMAKSSELNILVPKPDGEFEEYPVPEQFKTKFTGKGLETTHTDPA